MDNTRRPSQDQEAPEPETPLVTVLQTGEAGLLPLVRMALEQAGIEYTVRNSGISDLIIGNRATATVGNTTLPFEVLVRSEDQRRARELLRDLDAPSAPAEAPVPQAGPPSVGVTAHDGTGGRVDLLHADSDRLIGSISEDQFAAVAAHLERESRDDRDYYVDEATLAMLEESGVDAAVVALLRGALAGRAGIDVKWVKR